MYLGNRGKGKGNGCTAGASQEKPRARRRRRPLARAARLDLSLREGCRLVERGVRVGSQALLEAMNDRQGMQLQLQSTVEGLSVAAITYYIVGLISYLAKGALHWGWPWSGELTAAAAIPAVALGVWWSLRRMHRRVFHG